ncbi:rhodanese-like domain-containing protein [Hydrogenimonas urashimensis]|uniref:rhodanese-like domain-containing protein n=1 Tax=Hydrogenimonas urashimensis TaxID=2740515 RepID=UPI001916936D|nr:rhodanese-like domain-containing protein [Hydrogenimonas urashimensis]
MTPEEISNAIHLRPTAKMLESGVMKIIDIRTEPEWRQTGIVPGAACITFFDAYGNYDIDKFMEAYEKIADKESLVGLICRTGSRTRMVTNFLRQQGYNVVNLDGGIFYLRSIGFELIPYQPQQ